MVEVAAHRAGVVGVGVHAPDVGHALLRRQGVHALRDAIERIPVAHAQPEELQPIQRGRVGEQFGRRPSVRRRGHDGNPVEHVEVGEADVQGLARSHRHAGDAAVGAIGRDRVVGLDERDDLLQQVVVIRLAIGGLRAVALLLVGRRGRGVAAGKHDDHRHHLAFGDQVVGDDRRPRPLHPFGAGVAQAVLQIEHRIPASGRIAGRRVDAQRPADPQRLGVVLDELDLAMRDVLARDIEALGRDRIGGQVLHRAHGLGGGQIRNRRAPCSAGGGRPGRARLEARPAGSRAALGVKRDRRCREHGQQNYDVWNRHGTAHGRLPFGGFG